MVILYINRFKLVILEIAKTDMRNIKYNFRFVVDITLINRHLFPPKGIEKCPVPTDVFHILGKGDDDTDAILQN